MRTTHWLALLLIDCKKYFFVGNKFVATPKIKFRVAEVVGVFCLLQRCSHLMAVFI